MPLSFASQLEQDGIVILDDLVSPDALADMREAFEVRLRRLRWNDFDGYEKTERYRHMVQDVLTLAQGFVDLALHPVVKETLRQYLGPSFALVEAKGWRSLPTKRNFHGWHGDAWYDQETVPQVPREVKLAVYLTDVRSGAFHFIKGSHGQRPPRPVRRDEVDDVPPDRIAVVTGRAGTAFLFDTSGIHRQGMPILERRHAVFYNYHDPRIPLQREDVEYYRYHPLLLNAAFLGGLSSADHQVLGFGDKMNYVPAFERRLKHSGFQDLMRRTFDAQLSVDALRERIVGKLARTFRRVRAEPVAVPVSVSLKKGS